MSVFRNTYIAFQDSPALDAFGRMRVTAAHSVFDSQFTYNLQPLLWEQVVSGTGASISHDTTNRMATMTFASTPPGGKAFMQTYEHFRYVSGKSQLIFMTPIFGSGVANVVKFCGYSDGTEGIEFQLSGTTKQFVLYSTTSNGNQTVAQSSWNLDKLDGTGRSGAILDLTKSQILVIDFQSLYHGRVRVGFDIEGQVVYVHEFLHANMIAYPYWKTANLPLRCGMTSAGTVTATMNLTCASVIQESDGSISEGYHFSQEGTVTAGNGARTHILSLQPKTTFNSITNRTKFVLDSVAILVTGNNPILWELCLGDAITGTTTFNDVNTTYSAMQYNTAGTTSGSPAIVLNSGYVSSSATAKGEGYAIVPFKYPITLDAAGAARVMGRLTLLVTGIGNTSATRAILSWKEIR